MASVGQKVLKITGAVSQNLSDAEMRTARNNAGSGNTILRKEFPPETLDEVKDLYRKTIDHSAPACIFYSRTNDDNMLFITKREKDSANNKLIFYFSNVIERYYIFIRLTFTFSSSTMNESTVTAAEWDEDFSIMYIPVGSFDPAGTYPEMTAGRVQAINTGELYSNGIKNNFRLMYVSRDLSDDQSYEAGAIIEYTVRDRSGSASGLLYFYKQTSYLTLRNYVLSSFSPLDGIVFKLKEDEDIVATQGKKYYTIIAEVPASTFANFTLTLTEPGFFKAEAITSSSQRTMGSEINADAIEVKSFLARQNSDSTTSSTMRPVYCDKGVILPCDFAIKVNGVTSDTGVIFLV